MNPEILILSGPIHTGKSTALLNWCKLNSSRLRCAGIINPSIYAEKVFIELPTFESFKSNPLSPADTVEIGKYKFSQIAFNRADEIISKAGDKEADVFIIDEIGKLELRDQGLSSSIERILTNLHQSKTHVLILVVRDFLLEEVKLKYQLNRPVTIDQSIFETDRPPLVIMTGGQSKRMGQDKHSLNYRKGKAWMALKNRMTPWFSNIHFSINPHQTAEFLNESYIVDHFEEIGPIGGIASAFSEFGSDSIVFLACDMPLINIAVIDRLIREHDKNGIATCAKSKSKKQIEPLLSIWNRSALSEINLAIESGSYSLTKLLNRENVNVVEFDDEVFVNVNTAADFASIKERLKGQ